MTEEKKYKRTHYIVEREMQLKYAALILIHLVIFFVITALVIYFSGWREIIEKLSNVYPQVMLVGILNKIYMRLCIGFLLLLPVAVISAILASHKIAGPLVRIKRSIDQLAAGDYNLFVKLRKGDYLQDVADLLNKLVESLKKRK